MKQLLLPEGVALGVVEGLIEGTALGVVEGAEVGTAMIKEIITTIMRRKEVKQWQKEDSNYENNYTVDDDSKTNDNVINNDTYSDHGGESNIQVVYWRKKGIGITVGTHVSDGVGIICVYSHVTQTFIYIYIYIYAYIRIYRQIYTYFIKISKRKKYRKYLYTCALPFDIYT